MAARLNKASCAPQAQLLRRTAAAAPCASGRRAAGSRCRGAVPPDRQGNCAWSSAVPTLRPRKTRLPTWCAAARPLSCRRRRTRPPHPRHDECTEEGAGRGQEGRTQAGRGRTGHQGHHPQEGGRPAPGAAVAGKPGDKKSVKSEKLSSSWADDAAKKRGLKTIGAGPGAGAGGGGGWRAPRVVAAVIVAARADRTSRRRPSSR